MSRFVKIGKAAEILGVSIQTLRRWEMEGSLIPDRKSSGKTRYYDLDKLIRFQIYRVKTKSLLDMQEFLAMIKKKI